MTKTDAIKHLDLNIAYNRDALTNYQARQAELDILFSLTGEVVLNNVNIPENYLQIAV